MKNKIEKILKELGIEPTETCSCYYCISHFPVSDIEVWTTDEAPQAICPNCMVDSVILGDVSNIELEKLYEKWFNTFSEDEQ